MSTDPLDTLTAFAKSLSVTYPFVSDEDLHISKTYGVTWPLLGRDRRVTFLIAPDARISGVFNHELSIGRHVHDVLEALEALEGG